MVWRKIWATNGLKCEKGDTKYAEEDNWVFPVLGFVKLVNFFEMLISFFNKYRYQLCANVNK